MESLALFITIVSWIFFVGSIFVIIATNYIWYVKLTDFGRRRASRDLGLVYLAFLLSSAGLYSIYYGGVG